MTRDRFSKWYWSDWMGDTKLRACSPAARSLWMDMLGIMHEAEPVGHLLMNGYPISHEDLARIHGTSVDQVVAAMTELERKGVPSIENGVWINRRMVKDAKRRLINQKNGKGGGNPKLKGTKGQSSDNPAATIRITETDNQNSYLGLSTPDKTQNPESRDSSDTIVSGAAAPFAEPDLKTRIFGPALDWLAKATKRPQDKLRPLVGRWCRDHRDGPVLEALQLASRNAPLDPIPYIEKLLKDGGLNGPGNRKSNAQDGIVGGFFEAATEKGAFTDRGQRADDVPGGRGPLLPLRVVGAGDDPDWIG